MIDAPAFFFEKAPLAEGAGLAWPGDPTTDRLLAENGRPLRRSYLALS
ncbi:MAG TPA: hypothetical protein VGG72_11740 [Bryobacteraceae bacterium]